MDGSHYHAMEADAEIPVAPNLWTPANHSIVIFMLTRRKREAARRNAISQPLFLLGVAFRVVDYRLTRNREGRTGVAVVPFSTRPAGSRLDVQVKVPVPPLACSA